MTDRKSLPGKFVWFELACADAEDVKTAQAFYGEVLGWNVVPFPMGATTYDMIYAGETPDTMVGGYSPTKARKGSHWMSYVSVEDVDAAANAAVENGGQIVSAPMDVPGVGRMATIADPRGAELSLLRSARGDAPDVTAAPPGRFFWDELHTHDVIEALAFYERVLGFTHRSMDAGGGSAYHILSKGGVDRGGVTGHLPKGVPPHWLPYVAVDDPDATLSRVKNHGGIVVMGAEDIPGVGRFGVLKDPTGAVLAIMKPMPRAPAR